MITQLHRPIASRLRGIWTALVTPFDADGELDLATLRALVAHQFASGVDGLLACGSTGETPALTDAEYRAVIATVAEAAGGRVLVMAGTGTSDTATTIARTRAAHAAGADLALVVVPPYTRPTQAGIVAHTEAVAAATPLPVVLYNVPSRTGTDLLPETAARLSRVPGILGIKEASGDVARAAWITRHANPDFAILAGDDALALPIMAMGGVGVISVASNVAPATVGALTTAALRGDLAEARRRQLELVDLTRALFVEPNPIPVKAAAALLGFGSGAMRLPLTAASPATVEALNRALRTVDETATALQRAHPEMRPMV